MRAVRLGIVAVAGVVALCGVVKVGFPCVAGTSIQTHVRAVASHARAPDMFRYLPVLR